MTKKKMATDLQEINPEFLFLKYKGMPSPWEIIDQAKRFGFKCKRYAKWKDVHVSSNSPQLLKQVGDSLIDSDELDLSEYGELMKVWERVQRWTKDKEGFSIEPDILPEYEKFARLIDVGSKKPDVIDLMIDECGYEIELISIDDRWRIFLSICIHNLFHTGKRYQCLVEKQEHIDISKIKWQELVKLVRALVVDLYQQIGFDVSSNDDNEVITLFIKEIGCCHEPMSNERSGVARVKYLPKVWLEKYEGGLSELVKFQYSDGNVIVKLNKKNKIFYSNDSLSKLLVEEDFWNLIGNTLHSHLNQIDDIQYFFDTFAKQIRLRS